MHYSPLLFGIYLDGLQKILEATESLDAPRLNGRTVPVLLYADDLALLSHSREGLQNLLDILRTFSHDRGLTVNIEKTKVLVFAKRKTSISPPLMYAEQPLAQVDSFKYLGTTFHKTKGFSQAIAELQTAGKRAVFALQRRCAELGIKDTRLICRLFDTLVLPVLSYGCEIWAPCASESSLGALERVHTQFLKSLIGVPINTPDNIVLAEFGRYPLRFQWWKQVLR